MPQSHRCLLSAKRSIAQSHAHWTDSDVVTLAAVPRALYEHLHTVLPGRLVPTYCLWLQNRFTLVTLHYHSLQITAACTFPSPPTQPHSHPTNKRHTSTFSSHKRHTSTFSSHKQASHIHILIPQTSVTHPHSHPTNKRHTSTFSSHKRHTSHSHRPTNKRHNPHSRHMYILVPQTSPTRAEVKERVHLYIHSLSLWAFTARYRMNFTFLYM